MPSYVVISPLGTTHHILKGDNLIKEATTGHLRIFNYTDISDAAYDERMNVYDFNMAIKIIRKDKEGENG